MTDDQVVNDTGGLHCHDAAAPDDDDHDWSQYRQKVNASMTDDNPNPAPPPAGPTANPGSPPAAEQQPNVDDASPPAAEQPTNGAAPPPTTVDTAPPVDGNPYIHPRKGLLARKLARAVMETVTVGFNDADQLFYTYDSGVWIADGAKQCPAAEAPDR